MATPQHHLSLSSLACALSSRKGLHSGITYAKFEKLGLGATHDKAASILGFPGELIELYDDAGIREEIYLWANSDGSNVLCMLKGGMLVAKAQVGLK